MFTGIIEALGQVKRVSAQGTNKTFWVESPLFADLKVDQSLAHNGVCLTVERLEDGLHQVTAVKETLEKTSLHQWEAGSFVNLERSLQPSSRLDGHFVQGHVDATGRCRSMTDCGGSTEIVFEFPEGFAPLVIEKGSICIDGISLTAFDVSRNTLKVAIIPYTFAHTNLQYLKEGAPVNLEFDMIGKYILRNARLSA
ncbi:riboflavin synthase [Paraflavisolibacter sp. H34]|uniref:riboflavin synthase n=1 Tax=Huijunlia imazamoxiresistens TaxID=3127457 RepID=UPI003019207C